MSDFSPAELRRRLETISRTATHLRAHIADLHTHGWEPATSDNEKVTGGQPDRIPRSGHPQARHLYERIVNQTVGIEADLVGLDRAMTALFYAGSSSPEPSRGSMISRADFDAQLARQRARHDTPARLVDQPQHPGANR